MHPWEPAVRAGNEVELEVRSVVDVEVLEPQHLRSVDKTKDPGVAGPVMARETREAAGAEQRRLRSWRGRCGCRRPG